jgi:hypothetical protein
MQVSGWPEHPMTVKPIYRYFADQPHRPDRHRGWCSSAEAAEVASRQGRSKWMRNWVENMAAGSVSAGIAAILT